MELADPHPAQMHGLASGSCGKIQVDTDPCWAFSWRSIAERPPSRARIAYRVPEREACLAPAQSLHKLDCGLSTPASARKQQQSERRSAVSVTPSDGPSVPVQGRGTRRLFPYLGR